MVRSARDGGALSKLKSRVASGPRGRAVLALLLALAALALGVHAAAGKQSSAADPIASGWGARSLEGQARPTDVQNNLVGGALTRRDRAVSDWRAALARYRQGKAAAPGPGAKPEYVGGWAGNSDPSDQHGPQGQGDAGAGRGHPLRPTRDQQDRE